MAAVWACISARADDPPLTPGSVLIASGEGISVFNRSGDMPFGKFFVPVADGKGSATPWSDMGYDGWKLKSGHYLCSAHEWVREISPKGEIVWEYRVQKPVELKTCVPLPNGDVVTTDVSTQELVWLKKGGVVKRVPIPSTMKAAPHSRYNLLRRTPAGTFLLALRAEKAFIEIDESGKELWRHPVPDLPVVAERLANGNTLMSWRGGLLEVNTKHEVMWELKAADIKEFTVLIFGGFHRFENGNTLIVIEHNMDVIKCADWIIDIRPEGGNEGGHIVFQGLPEDLVKEKKSITGKFLKEKI